MEQELFAFVSCAKSLSPHLLGKIFTVRTDHKNLVYLSNSIVLKLVRWRVLLLEFRFHIEHIPGTQNVVADGLTSIFHVNFKKLSNTPSVQYCFKEDSTQQIFHIDNFRDSGDSDSEDEGLGIEKVHDDDSEVKYRKGEAILEKFQFRLDIWLNI